MKKKITLVMMCLITILMALPVMTYGFEESLIEAKFSTNKEEYSGSEEIIGKLTIKNISNKKIGRLIIDTVYSENIVFMNTDIISDNFILEANKSLEIDLIYRNMEENELQSLKENNNSNSKSSIYDEAVQAGDSKSYFFWMFVLAISFCMMVIYTMKTKGNKKGILSLFLCVIVLVGITIPYFNEEVYADNIITHEMELTSSICVGGLEEEIKVNIIYAYEDELIDSDNDGITDYEEKIIGTNPEKIDSDDDGLDDYEEVAIIGTKPNEKDSNGNGIEDQNEDADKDGLSNIQECISGTWNYCVDSDGDLVSDYDEICVYMTNPLEVDTDRDGAGDLWEVSNGFEPLKFDEKFSVDCLFEGNDTSVEIELVAKGENIESFCGSVYDETPYTFNSLAAGYMGSAYDFSMSGEFESAKIKYYFDDKYLEDEELNPTVFYLNEETKQLEEIETYWDGVNNYVTAVLEHFSTYILLNKTDVEKVWNADIKGIENAEENKNLNIAFVVDISGSMRGNQIKTAKEVVFDFLEVMNENDLATIVGFSNNIYSSNCFEANDRLKLKSNLNAFYATGGTAMYKGLNKALDLFGITEMDGEKIIIVISDGEDSPSVSYSTYSQIIERAKKADISIYTIGTGSVDEELLTNIAEGTEGKYYYANYVKELADKMESIKKETVDYYTDSNNDGISDYYTRLICDGTLKSGTLGVLEEWIGKYDEVQASSDFDKDGAINGEEIKIVNEYGKYFSYVSDPCKIDTDDDGLNDKEEFVKGTNPFFLNIKQTEVDKLLKNEIYLASIFSKDYLENGVLRTKLGLSNALLKCKLSYTNDYKKALVEYIYLYNDMIYEYELFQTIKSFYEDIIDGMIYDITKCVMVATDLTVRSEKYFDIADELLKCKSKLVETKADLNRLTKISEIEGFDAKLNSEYNDVYDKLNILEKQDMEFSKKIKKDIFVEGKYAENIAKIVNKMPDKAKKFIKVVDKYSTCIDIAAVALDVGMENYEMIQMWSSLCIGITDIGEMEEFIGYMWLRGDANQLTAAAEDVRYYLNREFNDLASLFEMVSTDVSEGARTILLDIGLSKGGPLGWAIGIGSSLGDMMFGTGDMNEKLLAVIAYGDLTTKNAEFLRMSLKVDSVDYYVLLSGSSITQFQLLAQARIVGEDKYVEAGDERGSVAKTIAKWLGEGQSELREMCVDNINMVYEKSVRLGLFVVKSFYGAHCN